MLSYLYKAVMIVLCTLRLLARLYSVPRYDIVIIHREIFPFGSAFFERLVIWLNPRTIYDLDDAIWLPTPLTINQRKLWWRDDRTFQIIAKCQTVVVGNQYIP